MADNYDFAEQAKRLDEELAGPGHVAGNPGHLERIESALRRAYSSGTVDMKARRDQALANAKNAPLVVNGAMLGTATEITFVDSMEEGRRWVVTVDESTKPVTAFAWDRMMPRLESDTHFKLLGTAGEAIEELAARLESRAKNDLLVVEKLRAI